MDAIRAEGPPGTLVRLEGEDVAPAVASRLSPHQVGVADLLDGARWRDRYPDRLVLLGLVPETLDLGLRRSRAVEAALPALVISGSVLIAGCRHLPREMALMLAKLRAAPTRRAAIRPSTRPPASPSSSSGWRG